MMFYGDDDSPKSGSDFINDFHDFLGHMSGSTGMQKNGSIGKQDAKQLKASYDKMIVNYEFKPGMIVKWKEGLRNKAHPTDNEPVIIMEMLDNPMYDLTIDSSSAYFHEPLDIALGMINDRGELICYYFDSRRFEPVSEI
jgi:hypothetical protein